MSRGYFFWLITMEGQPLNFGYSRIKEVTTALERRSKTAETPQGAFVPLLFRSRRPVALTDVMMSCCYDLMTTRRTPRPLICHNSGARSLPPCPRLHGPRSTAHDRTIARSTIARSTIARSTIARSHDRTIARPTIARPTIARSHDRTIARPTIARSHVPRSHGCTIHDPRQAERNPLLERWVERWVEISPLGGMAHCLA